MAAGTVISFNPDKRYGFIQDDNGSEHVMLHEQALSDRRDVSRLKRGVRVVYDPRRTERGLRASNVRLAAGEHPGGDPSAGDDEADVLTGAQFRDELSTVLASAVQAIEELARNHGWVE